METPERWGTRCSICFALLLFYRACASFRSIGREGERWCLVTKKGITVNNGWFFRCFFSVFFFFLSFYFFHNFILAWHGLRSLIFILFVFYFFV